LNAPVAKAPTDPFSVAVYCGARHGNRASYAEAARQLGSAIGERGWQLVYGGGKVGLMGEVADASLAAGGKVVGVIPESLMQAEVGHLGLTELHVVHTMHIRKQMMAERAQVFIALPGGIGTLEELYEVWTWRQLAYHDQPIGLLNVDGYFDSLLQFMRHAEREGFVARTTMDMVQVHHDPLTLLLDLAQRAVRADKPDNYVRI
jgi:uncharacterized protein (TIGR00730 family)